MIPPLGENPQSEVMTEAQNLTSEYQPPKSKYTEAELAQLRKQLEPERAEKTQQQVSNEQIKQLEKEDLQVTESPEFYSATAELYAFEHGEAVEGPDGTKHVAERHQPIPDQVYELVAKKYGVPFLLLRSTYVPHWTVETYQDDTPILNPN